MCVCDNSMRKIKYCVYVGLYLYAIYMPYGSMTVSIFCMYL